MLLVPVHLPVLPEHQEVHQEQTLMKKMTNKRKENPPINKSQVVNINTAVIESTGLKSPSFLSALFGSFISVIYFMALLMLSGDLKVNSLVEGLLNFLEAFPILWILFCVILLINFKTLGKVIRNKRQEYRFSEKMHLAFVFFVYFCITILTLIISKFLGWSIFYVFVGLSTWSIGALFSDSMNIALERLKKLEGNLK